MNIVPKQRSGLVLGFLPLALIAAVYLVASAERRAVNPDDKLLPPVTEMAETVRRLAIEPTPYNYELDVDLREQMTLCDAAGTLPLMLGGDHSIVFRYVGGIAQ